MNHFLNIMLLLIMTFVVMMVFFLIISKIIAYSSNRLVMGNSYLKSCRRNPVIFFRSLPIFCIVAKHYDQILAQAAVQAAFTSLLPNNVLLNVQVLFDILANQSTSIITDILILLNKVGLRIIPAETILTSRGDYVYFFRVDLLSPDRTTFRSRTVSLLACHSQLANDLYAAVHSSIPSIYHQSVAELLLLKGDAEDRAFDTLEEVNIFSELILQTKLVVTG